MMCVLLSMATVDTVDLGPPMAIFQVALVILAMALKVLKGS